MNVEDISISEELLNDPNYSRKTIQIRQDRTLSYSQCGNLESDRIVFFHIGLMGSSLVTIFVHHQALQLNLRLIVVDYPGTGDSTNMPGRTLRDWGEDIEEFCHQILSKDQQIILLGHCLGVPHALAVWARMKERVSRVTLVAPWVGDMSSNPWWMKYVFQQLPLQGYIPSVGAPLLNSTTYLNYPLSYVMPLEVKKLLRAINAIQCYNRNQGSAGNKEMIRMALISGNKEEFWDPILQEIAANNLADAGLPIQVFHGSYDAMVTLTASELLVQWLEEARCRVEFSTMEGADHNTILIEPTNMASILSPLAELE
jgi:pimeloyl-ACP methyl ester carboxylesterase